MKTFLAITMLLGLFGLAFSDVSTRVVAKKKAFLDRIIISRVEFEDTTIEAGVDFAWARTVELDNQELQPSRKGVSISLRRAQGLPRNPYEQKINYHAKNITLTDLLREIAKLGRLDLYTTSVGIVFCPPGFSPFPNSTAAKGEIWETLYKVPRDAPGKE